MRKLALILALTMIVLGPALKGAQAQAAAENSQQKTTTPDKLDQKARSLIPYRLDFTFSEWEAGKTINTRHYSLDLTAGSSNELRIGTRVPVVTGSSTGPATYQYMDVGTRIWANLGVEGSGDLRLDVKSEISNLDVPQSHDLSQAPVAATAHPVVRQIQIGGTTLLVTGRPIIIGTMDDPNSNREFRLEVTATKLR
jgi:hypothetical protein